MTRWAYYNENDPYAAQWLRNLIAAGHIADGEVDDRSIVDVRPEDLGGFAQCHFFAGIGGWSYALRLAGWPDDQPVWTGSCPCQPLSVAGHRQGHADERHLWPAFYGLIAECKAAVCFGEQVASKDGREWLAGIRADLEAAGYAVGAANLPATCIGALHQRERLWFVAYAEGEFVPKPGPAWERRERSGHRSMPEDSWMHTDNGAPKSGIPFLVDGFSGRVERSRAYGNAIVPQVAAEFIGAVWEAIIH